jgi:hypothetical protein
VKNKIDNFVIRLGNLILLSAIPILHGCGGGGGGSASVGSLFSPASTTLASLPGGGSGSEIVNPEPATMLLMGGGMLALGYLRRHSTRKSEKKGGL